MSRRTTPIGFWRRAKEFEDAASIILNSADSKILLPVYYLLGHSIELSLKAFLVGRGTPIDELKGRRFRHDLVALLKEARRRKMGLEVKLNSTEVNAIYLLNFNYAAKRFEYHESGNYRLPMINVSKDVTHKLVCGLKKYCEIRSKHSVSTENRRG